MIEAGSGYGTPLTSEVELQPNVWRHVTMVNDSDKIIIYIDGKKVSEASCPEWLDTAAMAIGVGCNPLLPEPNKEHFRGVIDDVRLYERALTAEEVRKAMEEK